MKARTGSRYYVFSGNSRIKLPVLGTRAVWLSAAHAPGRIQPLALGLENFFRRHGAAFSGKRVGVILPDATRDFHPRQVLPPLARQLERLARRVEFWIAPGLHRPLEPGRLRDFLGADFVKRHHPRQHRASQARPIGLVGAAPVWLNPRLRAYDVLFTVGVVEPHLYAGFSGGVKGISIGMSGRRAILHTHSVEFLSRPGVGIGSLRRNPFQHYVWSAFRRLRRPAWSLNLVNTIDRQVAFYSLGRPEASYAAAVRAARRLYTCPVRRTFAAVLVGCDPPKDESLYQASRLFNYMLESRLVRPGGAVVVFARADGRLKSEAEKNFEHALRRRDLPLAYAFRAPGEHRAFKVLQAARAARLGLVSPTLPDDLGLSIRVLRTVRSALAWLGAQYGDGCSLGVIPAGFSFLPSRGGGRRKPRRV